MNIKKIKLLIWALCISNIYNTSYKTTSPQLINKITKLKAFYKPRGFNTYKPALPLSTTQINNLLIQQPAQIQNKISNHPFFKDLIIEVNQVPNIEITHQTPIKFNQKTLLKLEIFMYCLEHLQEAEEIMNFYQEIKDTDHLIKDKLKLLPPHAQEFFKKELQKYLDSKEIYDQDIHPIKAKILRFYPYVIPTTYICYFIIILSLFMTIENFKEMKDKHKKIMDQLEEIKKMPDVTSNTKHFKEQQLLEIFELLIDALDLEQINLYRVKEESIKAQKNVEAGFSPFYKFIELNPSFFFLHLDHQILTLLHELRHYQQNTQIVIPKEVIEYAKSCGVQEYDFNFTTFWLTGWFWSPALVEFDADLFAARQMKDYPNINKLSKEAGFLYFNPKRGYFSSEMVLKESSEKTLAHNIENTWNNFIDSLPNENIYLQYVPQHLKEAAIKNRAIKEEKKQALQEAKQLFEEYREF